MIHMGMTLLIPTRNSLLKVIFGIPIERAIKFHRWLGMITWAMATTHGALEINLYGKEIKSICMFLTAKCTASSHG